MVAAGEEAESLSAAPSLANVSAPLVSGHVGTGSMSSIPATHNPLDKAPKRVMLVRRAALRLDWFCWVVHVPIVP